MNMVHFKKLTKILFACLIMAILASLVLMASCGRSLRKKEEQNYPLVYRDDSQDSVLYVKKPIATEDFVHHENQMEKILYSTVGFLLVLMLSGLLWFLRSFLAESRENRVETTKLGVEVSKLQLTLAASTQWDTDFTNTCTKNHISIEREIDDHETRIRTLEKK